MPVRLKPLSTQRRNLTPYSFLLPSLIIIGLFWFLPIFASFALSLTKWRGIGPIRFAGLANYVKIFQTDEFWVALKNTTYYSFVTVPIGLVLALGSALVWALYTDVADYGEWKSGRRATGLVFSAAMFAQKMGLTIGGAASGWLLAASGFVANQEQTPEALMGIRVMFCIIPGALALLNGIILLFYPLSTARTEQMYRELKAIREAAKSAVPENE